MKAKRLLSILLTALLLLSAVFVPTAVSAETAYMNTQHIDVDFSSYKMVDYKDDMWHNNVYTTENSPQFSIAKEADGNDYLKVTKTATQTANWKPHHCIIINPTGDTAGNGYYYVTLNQKYRATFKYKLAITDEGTSNSRDVSITAVSMANTFVRDEFNTISGNDDWWLGETKLEATDEWQEASVDFKVGALLRENCASSLAFKIGVSDYKFGYELCIDDVTVDALASVTLNNADGTATELWGAPKATAYGDRYADYEGQKIDFPNLDTTDWYYDAEYTKPVDTANAVFQPVYGASYYAKSFVGTPFSAQHSEVDFSKYEVVDWNVDSSKNNVWMGENTPQYSIAEDDNSNAYLKITKSSSQNNGWLPVHCIIINPTGSATKDGSYEIKLNQKYRVTFKYKLAVTENGSSASYGATLSAISMPDYKVIDGSNGGTLASTGLEATDTWKEATIDFLMDTYANESKISSFAFFIGNLTGTAEYEICIDDVVIDALSSVTLHKADGSTEVLTGAPACTATNGAYSAFKGEAFDLPLTAEMYSYTTDSADATAKADALSYYYDENYTKAINTVFPAATGGDIYTKTTAISDTTHQMAFTGFEDGVYSSRKPSDYLNGSETWYYFPTVLFRESSGFSFADEAFTGSKSLKYTATSEVGNYRALYIGNGFEFTPDRTYAVSFYVKAGENNTAKTITLGVRGGIGCGQWSLVQNNIETKTVDLTKSGWQKVTILYTPNEVTEAGIATSVNAYYVPQLFMDYVNRTGESTEGAELYIDTVSIDVIPGDVNGDGDIDIIDLVRAKKIAVSDEGYSAEDIKAANLDAETDGVTATDLASLRTMLLKDKEDNSPVIGTLTDSNGQVIDLSDYGYVWGDEFNGDSLDYLKWGTAATFTDYSDVNDTEDNISVSDGVLTLATTYNDGVYTVSNDLRTNGTMNFKYGYIEYRAKVPFVRGAWATLWATSNAWMNPETFTDGLNPSDDDVWYNADYNSEIDFLELGNGENGFVTNLHNFTNSTDYQVKNKVSYSITSDFDANAWHTYGYLWTDSELIMLVDGKEYGRYNLNDTSLLGNGDMSGFDDWMNLRLSNKIYSSEYCKANTWATDNEVTDSSANFDLQIDYVRVYQQRSADTMIHIKK